MKAEWYLKIPVLLMAAVPVLFVGHVGAEVYLLEEANGVLGRHEYHTTLPDESLIEIARNFSIGYNSITESNRGLNPFVPGTAIDVTINTGKLLPDTELKAGIVINLSDYRLYCFFSEGEERFVAVFPIGIGDDHWETPLGSYSVVDKLIRPAWAPPPSIRKEDPSLPLRVPPGPENPLGSHALRLSQRSILIHGTHRPYSVGRKASHGCIHLYPEDIPILFGMVKKGTKVSIVRQPVKVGMSGGRIFIQVHDDTDFKDNYVAETKRVLERKDLQTVDYEKLMLVIRERNGIPTDITAD